MPLWFAVPTRKSWTFVTEIAKLFAHSDIRCNVFGCWTSTVKSGINYGFNL